MPNIPVDARDLVEGTAFFRTVTGSATGVRLRDVDGALSVELSVDGQPGAIFATTPTQEADVVFCLASAQAIQRSIDLVSSKGGGKVRIPPVYDGVTGNLRPFMYFGPLVIKNGVELVVDGLLKVCGALDADRPPGGPYGTMDKRTTVRFGSDIAYGALTGRGVIDGNARANNAAIAGWAAQGPALIGQCAGVTWSAEKDELPPRFVGGSAEADSKPHAPSVSLQNEILRPVRTLALAVVLEILVHYLVGDRTRAPRTVPDPPQMTARIPRLQRRILLQ